MLETVEVFRGLSEPIRLRIVALLTEGELCVCDLMEVLDMPQSTISRHMARLKSSGLVIDRRAGKWVHYSLANKGLSQNIHKYLTLDLTSDEPYLSDIKKLKKYLKLKESCE